MTAEKPIIFNTEMVRAILDGRKTQTRRVVKNQDCVEWDTDGKFVHLHDPECQGGCDYNCVSLCPYGQPGDRLWVREAWRPIPHLLTGVIIYKAGGDDVADYRAAKAFKPGSRERYRPSIHMPRWASRITLEITGIRVERVQEISEEDATAEGVTVKFEPTGIVCESTRIAEYIPESPSEAFARLWDSINAKRGYSWDGNPWVWVVEFKKLEATNDR